MKNYKILLSVLLFSVISGVSANTKEKNSKNETVKEKNQEDDICSITYSVKQNIDGATMIIDYTFTATTCEEVEAAAIEAGIIKKKK
ncbi:hypothetical protein [Flavobacterium sp. J27]|uniref:hypothetical protein n=1 Tax=Flavobacterium sp. J27 TaxID=2060419 RepID=UPI0010315B65|nr:hypothetical protein [Flavobacterium sp. J27]